MKTDLTAAQCIAALRHCTDDSTELCVDDKYRCPLWNEDRMTDYCKADLMLAAADIIEAQQVDLRKANEIITEGIKASRKSRAELETAEKLIAELEAQIPKEGEWNIRETALGDVEAKCPKCGFEMLVNQPGNGLLVVSELLYCPHCGSRMAKGEQDG